MQLPWPFGGVSSTTAVKPDVGIATQPTVDVTDEPAQQTKSARALTRAEKAAQADFEFNELVKSFEAGAINEKKNVKVLETKTTEQRKAFLAGLEPRLYEDGTIDIRPEVMYPQTMSCRQAFDQAFYCQSLGGKFNDIYRYGELKSCSEQWSAFWFCMRTRTMDDAGKAAETVGYYKKRDEERKRAHGSSEDVWDIRTRSVAKAFWKNPDELEKRGYQD